MATTYDSISRNKLWTIGLIFGYIGLLAVIGLFVGYDMDNPYLGIGLAVVVAALMNITAFFGGDKIALFSTGAKGPITKEQNSYYWNLVENLSIATGLPMPKLFIIEDQTINAFATGRDPKHASIAVTTGALEQLENEELEGVLAHELSHIKNYDVRYMMIVLVLFNTVILLSRFFYYSSRGRRSDENRNGGNIFAIVGLVLLILSPLIAQLLRFAISRRRELLADASGALMTRYPEGLANALEKIQKSSAQRMSMANDATAHLFFSNPFGRTKKITSLFMTHPPIEERIAALRKMGA